MYKVTRSAKCIQEKDGGFEGPGDVMIEQPVLDEDRASIWEGERIVNMVVVTFAWQGDYT